MTWKLHEGGIGRLTILCTRTDPFFIVNNIAGCENKTDTKTQQNESHLLHQEQIVPTRHSSIENYENGLNPSMSLLSERQDSDEGCLRGKNEYFVDDR